MFGAEGNWPCVEFSIGIWQLAFGVREKLSVCNKHTLNAHRLCTSTQRQIKRGPQNA